MTLEETTKALTDKILASSLETDIERARWIATWLDSKFSVMGVKFGLEGIAGFIPFFGDTIGVLAGLYPLYVARRHNLSNSTRGKIAMNLATEWMLGFLPFVGDAADVWFKANLRNVELLEREAASRGLIVQSK